MKETPVDRWLQTLFELVEFTILENKETLLIIEDKESVLFLLLHSEEL